MLLLFGCPKGHQVLMLVRESTCAGGVLVSKPLAQKHPVLTIDKQAFGRGGVVAEVTDGIPGRDIE